MAVTLESLVNQLEGVGSLNPNNYFRAHGTAGLEDFKRSNIIRANPSGIYDSTYYSQGGPETRYLKRGSGSIVEAMPSKKIEHIPDSRRYAITTPENTLGLSDRIRVYEKSPTGYKSVYDNITPWKFGLRTLANDLGPMGLLSAGEGVLSSLFLPKEERTAGRVLKNIGESFLGTRQPTPAESLTLQDILKF